MQKKRCGSFLMARFTISKSCVPSWKATGINFAQSSDTEVIIHGYKEWGTEVLNHLNGMFGLAIWDVYKERLIVARDAMGIKLIYYRIANGQLTFGSEIRPLLVAARARSQTWIPSRSICFSGSVTRLLL